MSWDKKALAEEQLAKERRHKIQTAPLRQHRLFAYAKCDDDLRKVTSRKLIRWFALGNLGEVWDDDGRGRVVMRYGQLEEYSGDRYFKQGTMRFCVRSPDLPYFGAAASNVCKEIPIVYSSHCTVEGPGKRRFFYGGRDVTEGRVSPGVAKAFAALLEAGMGIIPGKRTLEAFFDSGG